MVDGRRYNAAAAEDDDARQWYLQFHRHGSGSLLPLHCTRQLIAFGRHLSRGPGWRLSYLLRLMYSITAPFPDRGVRMWLVATALLLYSTTTETESQTERERLERAREARDYGH